jgi:hypothetical protein
MPQTLFIANGLQLNINSRVYSLDEREQVHEIYRYNLDENNGEGLTARKEFFQPYPMIKCLV